MLCTTSSRAPLGLLLSLLAFGCGDKGSSANASSSAAASSTATARGSSSASATGAADAAAPAATGLTLEGFEDVLESPTGKLGNKLHVDGPAAVFLSPSPLPGPKQYASFNVFPAGTDASTICDSDFPGPKKKNEYVLSVSGQYDGDLKPGVLQGESMPGAAYLSKDDNGNITSAAIGKVGFMVVEVLSVQGDSVNVKVSNKPGAPFTLSGSFTAKICKSK